MTWVWALEGSNFPNPACGSHAGSQHKAPRDVLFHRNSGLHQICLVLNLLFAIRHFVQLSPKKKNSLLLF